MSSMFDLRILILEDETTISTLVAAMLNDLGCAAVKTAVRRDQALNLIRSEEIDVAILDVNLKGQDSYPVANELEVRNIPFLFLTGYESEYIPERYRNRPVLQKPFSERDLVNILSILALGL